MSLPARVKQVEVARRKHGDLIDRLAPALHRTDPLADAVAEELAAMPMGHAIARFDRALRGDAKDTSPAVRQLIESMSEVPAWVDWDRIERAGATLFRTGAAGGIVLGAKCLVHGYAAPAGNKPLVLSGKLRRGHVPRRLAETSRFVAVTCEPGALRRNGEGFVITGKVRLIHAQVRRLLRERGYREDLYCAPISQHDMMATMLLFSHAFLEGVRTFGYEIDHDEADDFIHLWRWSSALMGVEPELLPATDREAARLADVIAITQGEPDADSRELVRDLMEHDPPGARQRHPREIALAYGFCRTLIGDELADALAVPKTPHRFAIDVARPAIKRFDRLQRRSRFLREQAIEAGHRYWRMASMRDAAFEPPGRLEGASQKGNAVFRG